MLDSGHLSFESIEGIPEIFPQDYGLGFGVVDDETALFRMKTKIDGNSPDPGLEAGKEGLQELRAILEKNRHIGSLLNP
jgi:hypothetical protein